jgi:hypothetical protein
LENLGICQSVMEASDDQASARKTNRRLNTAPRSAIEDAKDFGLAFAQAVTSESSDPTHWIARKGNHSLFRILKDLIPEVSPKCSVKCRRLLYLIGARPIIRVNIGLNNE